MANLLLVDGYNIIGAWPKLIKLRDQGDLEGAREQFIRDLLNFCHFRGWQVILVFDAYNTPQETTQVSPTPGFEIYYTAQNQTADSFIEQRSLELLRSGQERVYVATSDRAQRLLVQAQGAMLLSADLLRQEVQQAKREQQTHHTPQHSRKGRTLADRLDPKTLARLQDLQKGL